MPLRITELARQTIVYKATVRIITGNVQPSVTNQTRVSVFLNQNSIYGTREAFEKSSGVFPWQKEPRVHGHYCFLIHRGPASEYKTYDTMVFSAHSQSKRSISREWGKGRGCITYMAYRSAKRYKHSLPFDNEASPSRVERSTIAKEEDGVQD